jgi:hypothetical protein
LRGLNHQGLIVLSCDDRGRNLSQDELDDVLKYGAEELFEEEGAGTAAQAGEGQAAAQADGAEVREPCSVPPICPDRGGPCVWVDQGG